MEKLSDIYPEEKSVPKPLTCGDFVMVDGKVCIISSVGESLVTAICLRTGNRWATPVSFLGAQTKPLPANVVKRIFEPSGLHNVSRISVSEAADWLRSKASEH